MGDSRSQALFETLAVLIGVRVWAAALAAERWEVHVRSDSAAALGAAFRLRSPKPEINAVVRELALDLAEGTYHIDFVEHLPGRCNVVADALSRFYQPGGSQSPPPVLAGVPRCWPQVRSPSWWRSAGGPGDPAAGADTEAGHGHALGAAGAAQPPLAAAVGGVPRAGPAWDLKIGGALHDLRDPARRADLRAQLAASWFAFWAPECKTFSRARGRPVQGARSWPLAVRSGMHPYGLPELAAPSRRADAEKVAAGNDLALFTLSACHAAMAQDAGFAIENPSNSFLWELIEAKELAASSGVVRMDFSSCMFNGGQRNKKTAILTNAPSLAAALEGRICSGGRRCSRTGVAHASWDPVVRGGRIAVFPTEAEAEYSDGLCAALAPAIVSHGGWSQGRPFFTEVFAGPRAPLSRAVAGLIGGRPLPDSFG